MAENKNPPGARRIIGRLLFRESKHTGWLYIKLFMAILEKGLGLSFAFVLKVLIDNTLEGAMRPFLSWAMLLTALMLLQVPAAALGRYTGARYVALALRDMRVRSNQKMTELPLSYLNTHHSGDLLSRVTTDLGQIALFLETRFADTVMMLVAGAAALAVMLFWSWEVTLATFFAAPLFMMFAMRVGRPIEELTTAQNTELGHVSAAVQDAVGGAVEVKSYSLYDETTARHDQAVDRAVCKSVAIARASARVELANLLTVLVPVILICAVGVWMVLLGRITIGTLMAIITVSNDVRMPLQSWNQIVTWWKGAAGAARRVFEFWDEPSERTNGEERTVEPRKPLVSFQNVGFAYRQQEADGTSVRRVVFAGLDLNIKKGETVAVVGPSGCGKSTLIHLIAGFWQADSGVLEFGGHDVSRWNLTALRRHMALVQQDTYLFPGTLGENIACGAPVEQADLIKAAKKARIHKFITGLPQGYDTSAGERGVRISGGQRQRIAIARALLRNAPLLLLDEPTSALDMETEQEIQKEIKSLTRGRTAIIVAHRLSTIRDADRIVVLSGGRITEEGTHDQLMGLDGVYAGLVREQTLLEGGEAVGADDQ